MALTWLWLWAGAADPLLEPALYMVFQCANNCAYLNHLWTRSLIWQLATVDSTSARDPSSEDALLLVQKRRRRHDAHRFCFSARRSRGRLSGVVCAPAAAVMPRRTCSPGDVAPGAYDMNPRPRGTGFTFGSGGDRFCKWRTGHWYCNLRKL